MTAEGGSLIRSEKVSGKSRDELATILSFLRPGDELMVTRLDRLGRDTRDVLNIIHECEQKQAFVTVLDPYVSTKGEMGQIVMTVFGRSKGGKQRIDRDEVLRLAGGGDKPPAIARILDRSRMQVYRILGVNG